jgi:hypothetical protein
MVLAPSRNLPAAKFGGMDQKRIIHQYLDKHRWMAPTSVLCDGR